MTQTVGLTSGNTSCYAYDSAGVVQETIDGMGHKVTVSADSTTNYSLPTLVTPNDSSAMATSMTYASSFAVTSVTGPNGAQGTTTYDVYGRPGVDEDSRWGHHGVYILLQPPDADGDGEWPMEEDHAGWVREDDPGG